MAWRLLLGGGHAIRLDLSSHRIGISPHTRFGRQRNGRQILSIGQTNYGSVAVERGKNRASSGK